MCSGEQRSFVPYIPGNVGDSGSNPQLGLDYSDQEWKTLLWIRQNMASSSSSVTAPSHSHSLILSNDFLNQKRDIIYPILQKNAWKVLVSCNDNIFWNLRNGTFICHAALFQVQWDCFLGSVGMRLLFFHNGNGGVGSILGPDPKLVSTGKALLKSKNLC